MVSELAAQARISWGISLEVDTRHCQDVTHTGVAMREEVRHHDPGGHGEAGEYRAREAALGERDGGPGPQAADPCYSTETQ